MFQINAHRIGPGHPPFIIAEISANHNGDISRAKASILAAKQAGAHAVKLQTYTADTMTIDSDKPGFKISGGLWDGYKLYDLYGEACTPFEWHPELFAYAKTLGITLFSTPFDETAVDLLESVNAPAYKIASFELTDIPLIERVARTGKPMLMSTGMAHEGEIREAVEAARGSGAQSILLFHCISNYPSPIEDANLRNIPWLREKFGVEVGLSDHTIGHTAAIAAVTLGATAIEKHFTLSRADKGPDSEFSIEPDELQVLVQSTRDAWAALGSGELKRPDREKSSLAFRRSLYFVRDLCAGERITEADIRRIRPGYGLAPKHFDELMGRTLARAVERGDPVSWDDFQPQ